MVYSVYIKKRGRRIGPYYYCSIRLKNGKNKAIYLGNNKKLALRKEARLKASRKWVAKKQSIRRIALKQKTYRPDIKLFAIAIVILLSILFMNQAKIAGFISGILLSDWSNITSCTNITSSGNYYLNESLVDVTSNFYIIISANNVTLDCLENIIDGDNESSTERMN